MRASEPALPLRSLRVILRNEVWHQKEPVTWDGTWGLQWHHCSSKSSSLWKRMSGGSGGTEKQGTGMVSSCS